MALFRLNHNHIPRFIRFGMPLLIFVVAGSFGLSEFTDIKIKKKDEKVYKLSSEEAMLYQKKRKDKPVTIEQAFEEIQQEVDFDEWENKRGPRPWEENFEVKEDPK